MFKSRAVVDKILRRIFYFFPMKSQMRGELASYWFCGSKRQVSIRKYVDFYGFGCLSLGDRVMINNGVLIDLSGELVIGSDVAIGMRAMILTSTHKIGSQPRCGEVKRKKTIVGNNVWIGAGAIILPGSVLSDGCVVGAGEIVRGEVPEDILVLSGKFESLR